MCKQFGTVPDLVDLVSVDTLVLLYEALVEHGLIVLIDNAQTLSQEAVVSRERALLHATVNDHVDHLAQL